MKTPTLASLLLLGALGPFATAQRVAVPDEDGRMLQLFDLRKLGHDDQRVNEQTSAEQAQHAAKMLRHFVEPALRPGDDLCAIGNRWIAVLADADRIASVERLFQTAQRHRNDLMQVEIRLLEVPAIKFQQHLAKLLVAVERPAGTTFESVFGKDEAAGFLAIADKAAGQALVAPLVCVRPLQRANVAVINQTAYVKDFTVTRTKDAAIADPVIDTVWDGNRSDITATFLPGDRIGISCDVQFQELHRPIPTVETTVLDGTHPVTIQLPRTSGVRLSNVAEVADGSLVVLAAQRSNGDYMVAIVKASGVATDVKLR